MRRTARERRSGRRHSSSRPGADLRGAVALPRWRAGLTALGAVLPGTAFLAAGRGSSERSCCSCSPRRGGRGLAGDGRLADRAVPARPRHPVAAGHHRRRSGHPGLGCRDRRRLPDARRARHHPRAARPRSVVVRCSSWSPWRCRRLRGPVPSPSGPRRRRVRRGPRIGHRGGDRTPSGTRSGSTSCCSAGTAARAGTASAPTPSSWPASPPRRVRRRCSACRATSRTCLPGRQSAGRALPRRLRRRHGEREPAQRRVPQRPGGAPGRPGPHRRQGADFLKLGVGEALDLDLDYFVLVNLDGFSRLVDALGGVTVNVNYYGRSAGSRIRILPDDYLEPGPNQHLDGGRSTSPAVGSGRPTTTAWPASAARSTPSSTRPTR